MRKTPSYVKGLAEARARADASVLYLESLIQSSRVAVSALRAQLETAERQLRAMETKLEDASRERDSCDVLLKAVDPDINPADIKRIRGWAGKYGKRGALKTAIMAYLRSRAPDAVSLVEVGTAVRFELQLPIISEAELAAWRQAVTASPILCSSPSFLAEGAVPRERLGNRPDRL